jgi:hypothetical protein
MPGVISTTFSGLADMGVAPFLLPSVDFARALLVAAFCAIMFA